MGATSKTIDHNSDGTFQSTPPEWGATRRKNWYTMHTIISIHAPACGSDFAHPFYAVFPHHFNPRPPSGDDVNAETPIELKNISIHAPEWGATPMSIIVSSPTTAFQSTPPEWGATTERRRYLRHEHISTTPPEWGATTERRRYLRHEHISIHAPRVGSDARLKNT